MLKINIYELEWNKVTYPSGFGSPGLDANHFYPYQMELGTVSIFIGAPPECWFSNFIGVDQVTTATNICDSPGYLAGLPECGLTNLAFVNVTNPLGVINDINILTTPTSCTIADGTSTATPVGGTGPYTYQWFSVNPITQNQTSIGQTTQTATGLGFGIYAVTVTDLANGCSINTLINLNQEISINYFEVSFSSTGTSCAINDGTATATPSGGVGPYSYEWFSVDLSQNQTSIGQTTQTATGLGVGEYAVTVTDGNGCSTNSLTDLYENITIDFTYTFITTTTSQNTCTYEEGSATVTPVGGVAPYTYSWSNIPPWISSTNNILCGVTEGNYSVVVTDANLCTSSQVVIVNPTVFPLDYFDYPNGLIIDSPSVQFEDLNGDGKVRVRGTVIIKTGVIKTFNDLTIEFARDLNPLQPDLGETHSGIIIEKGARLNVNDCTLKGVDACDAMWEGIQVWGADYATFSNGKPPLVTLNHGKLYLNNSTIRDAHIGVALYRTNIPLTASPVEYGRGIVHAKFSTFLNNRASVVFAGRTFVENNSTIKQCSFICDAPLIDPCKYNGEGSDVFIQLSRVKNPLIYGNTFTGNTSFAINKRATGVRSFDASYIVQSGNAGAVSIVTPPTPNTFTNLSKGIDIYSKGGATKTVRVKDNLFNNVYQGITAGGSHFDEISFNTFNTPMGDVSFNSWAIFLETSSGFLITENNFNTIATNSYTWGVVTRNVQLISGQVYKNDFEGDFYAASQAEGIGAGNPQLKIDCNNYSGMNTFDWNILTTFPGSMPTQGSCFGTAESPASNIFSPCVSLESQINSSVAFDYNSSATIQPVCTSAMVTVNICFFTPYSFATACPQEAITIPCPGCVPALFSEFDNLPPGLEKEQVKGELVRRLAQEDDIQTIVTFLTTGAVPDDMRILIPTHIHRNECSEARSLLNSMDLSSTENQQFYALFDVLTTLCETGRVLEEITLSEKQIIESVATSNTTSATHAQSVLTDLNKTHIIRFPEQVPYNSAMAIIEDKTTETSNATKNPTITLYPNPSDGDMTLEVEAASIGQAQIFDAMGRVVLVFDLNESDTKYSIEFLPKGVYTLFVSYQNGTIETERILIE